MGKKKPPRNTGLSAQDIKNLMKGEFDHYLTDIEFRVKQAYEVSRRPLDGRVMSDSDIEHYSQYSPVMTSGQVYAEDINSSAHLITGYTVTANSPAAGQIAWTSVHIVYNGIDYAITDGNASVTDYYMYLAIAGATGTAPNKTATMSKSPVATKPVLGTGDTIVFLNQAGTPVSMLEQNLPRVVADGAVDTGALQGQAVTGAKIFNNTITAAQISNTANILGGSIKSGDISSTQLGIGAVTASRLNILEHVIY